MALHDFKAFAGDGHVLENDNELDRYFEGEWKGNRRPEFLADTRYSDEVKRKILAGNTKTLYGIK